MSTVFAVLGKRYFLILGLLLACPMPAYADRVAFGAFESAQNAENWAAKLSGLFDHKMVVTVIDDQERIIYRVTSQNLTAQAYSRMTRSATASGVRYWRGGEAALEAFPARAEKSQAAARIVPPSPPIQRQIGQGQTAGQMQWDLGLQTRLFAHKGDLQQDRAQLSVSAQLEYFRGWDNDTRSITFTPFLRLDSLDSKRSHADVRELFYSYIQDTWDVHVGAKRVFWGVTEFNHLIDVVNQTDLIENLDGEDKLGQPMVQFSTVRPWGVLDVYALLGFRERTYPGVDGRLRLPYEVLDEARYESGAEQMRTDLAIRWSHYLGPFELGLHHFSGTSREPMLLPEYAVDNEVVLRPYYPIIDQTGIDAQAFYGDWAFKLEGFTRSGYGDRYASLSGGLERTLVGVLGSRADFGLVLEYYWDERGDAAVNTLFEHDLALGGRLSLNDFADTQALLGVIYDTQYQDYVMTLEASRRIGNNWLLSLEGRAFAGGKALPTPLGLNVLEGPDYKSAWLQQDDYLQVEFKKFL